MSNDLQDAETLARDLRDPFFHDCPVGDDWVDSNDLRLLDCRCFDGAEFLAAQDAIAVALDSRRSSKDQ